MKKIKDEKQIEQIVQEMMTFLETNEYMNYFRFKTYAFNNDKHKWLYVLEESPIIRTKIHQYAENRRRKLGLKSNYDYAPSTKACKKAEKQYKLRQLAKQANQNKIENKEMTDLL